MVWEVQYSFDKKNHDLSRRFTSMELYSMLYGGRWFQTVLHRQFYFWFEHLWTHWILDFGSKIDQNRIRFTTYNRFPVWRSGRAVVNSFLPGRSFAALGPNSLELWQEYIESPESVWQFWQRFACFCSAIGVQWDVIGVSLRGWPHLVFFVFLAALFIAAVYDVWSLIMYMKWIEITWRYEETNVSLQVGLPALNVLHKERTRHIFNGQRKVLTAISSMIAALCDMMWLFFSVPGGGRCFLDGFLFFFFWFHNRRNCCPVWPPRRFLCFLVLCALSFITTVAVLGNQARKLFPAALDTKLSRH